MIRKIFTIALLWIGSPVFAQTVQTQTGEHANFTRVVLTIPSGSEWTIGRVPIGYGIQVENAESFDLTDFFELIPRDRISTAEVSEDGTLVLAVACDCHVIANQGPTRILVVDILDGAPPQEAQFEAALYPVIDVLPIAQPNEEIMMPVEIIELATSPPDESPELDLGLLTEVPVSHQSSRASTIPTPDDLKKRAEEQRRVSSLEVAVAESLSRAASQGLLELSDQLTVNLGGTDDQPNQSSDRPLEPPEGPEPGVIRPGIVANTSVDSSLSNVFTAQNIAAETLVCWPDSIVDVQSWGTDEPFGDQLAMRRRAITGEFDVTDPEAVENLAKLYVYFGFGREAVQTLEIDGVNSRARVILRSLAQIIDDDPVDDNGLLAQVTCPGPVALWAVLATDQVQSLQGVDQQFIARQFKLLPAGLQIHLGPRLASRIIMLDDPDTAENVLNRSVDAHTTTLETAMVESKIAQERGDLVDATQTLSDLTESELRLTPEAIIELISLQIDQDLPISPETLAHADSLKFEFKDTQAAADLTVAIVRAHRHSGAYSMAMRELNNGKPGLTKATVATLTDSILAGATVDADDGTFLDLAFLSDLAEIEPESENAAAARLLALGFPERASHLISGATNTIAMTERRYLRAEAAIALGDFALAQSHLAGIETERAAELLSFGLDGVPLASLTVSEGDSQSDASQDAWRNGSWDDLYTGDDPLLRDVSAMVLSPGSPEINPAAPLAGGRALIADANQARQTLSALMNRFDAPLLEDLQ